MKTLVENGPYAYTIMPQIDADGNVKMPIARTWDEVNECYKFVRGRSDMLSAEPLIEVRGAWYVFREDVTRGRPKGQPKGQEVIGENIVIGLFPCGPGKGITGELVWRVVPPETLGAASPDAPKFANDTQLRRHLRVLHDRYLDALRAEDVEGIVATMNARVLGVVRDYVNNTGTLTDLDGLDGHRAYYRALFEKYKIEAVDMMDRVVQPGYAFSELRFTMRPRSGGASAKTIAFHTAEYFIPGKDARFAVRVGHGTDPV
jgi:hypothetical protein